MQSGIFLFDFWIDILCLFGDIRFQSSMPGINLNLFFLASLSSLFLGLFLCFFLFLLLLCCTCGLVGKFLLSLLVTLLILINLSLSSFIYVLFGLFALLGSILLTRGCCILFFNVFFIFLRLSCSLPSLFENTREWVKRCLSAVHVLRSIDLLCLAIKLFEQLS
jgi:hypothetical protein